MKRNTPEPAGYALGAELAHFADNAENRLLKAGVPIPERCSTCTFSKGSAPNCCVTSVTDATRSLIKHVPFMCHHDKSVSTPCAGFMLVILDGLLDGLLPERLPGQAPWSFSAEVDAVRARLHEQGEREG